MENTTHYQWLEIRLNDLSMVYMEGDKFYLRLPKSDQAQSIGMMHIVPGDTPYERDENCSTDHLSIQITPDGKFDVAVRSAQSSEVQA